jgi:hypothetical protein
MNRIILFLILSLIILFVLFGHRMNEGQQGYRNHFWGIKTESWPGEKQITYGASSRNKYNSASLRRAITTPIKNNNLAVYDKFMQYELKRSPFKGPHGESQYEFLLRKP